MNNKGLTLTMVFEAESANFGESMHNISQLKKMSRADGNMYTYISRQAIRYNIVQQLGWDNTPVGLPNSKTLDENDDNETNNDNKKKVVQFTLESSIADYPEIDLFGYMKTKAKQESVTRSAVARLSNAIALEPYNSELDFLTNMGLARRKELLGNAIAQSEVHRSYYSYTVTVDLNRVGEDKNGPVSIPIEERARRVCSLLDTLLYLYRDIKGRRENMAPVFAIGGVFDRKCPYYEGRVLLSKNRLDAARLAEVIASCDDTRNNTRVGLLDNSFANDAEIKAQLRPDSVTKMFEQVKTEVLKYYV